MELIERARAWAELDPEESHRAEIHGLIEDHELARLEELFTGRLSFGTAGLRAGLGPGPNRMNRLVVRQTTQGLLLWMKGRGFTRPRIVIGFDARHGSLDFAVEAADTIGAAGAEAIRCDDVVPTPALAYAILTHEADAGIMVTASHNPPADNGYKLYLGDGIQIIPPADGEIADAIHRIAAGEPAPVFDEAAGPQLVPGRRWVDAHREAVLPSIPGPERSVRVVYTAMHGVGGAPFVTAALEAGFERPVVVDEQFDPDPDFPTVSFPNPEEPGALDLALALAQEHGVDAVIAHDPDADRLAIAVPSVDGWTQLSGDQVGALLANHVINAHLDGAGGPAVVAKSLVSSQRLEAIAAEAGVECQTTLTGFKWVARAIVDEPDAAYLLGYEEALGYCVGGIVRDKDGIGAALVAMQLLSKLKDAGRTVWDELADLDRRFGAYRTHSFSHRLSETGPTTEQILTDILGDPPTADSPVANITDLRTEGDLPPTDGVLVRYTDRARLIVRPSGTEPKVKFYLEAVGEPAVAEQALRDLTEAVELRLKG
ncbi:MAG: phospho-sugar mutase [Acidimicrobiales bacterium]|nr:phospho-sugar mutase [Acidimicrobiales bacterium]